MTKSKHLNPCPDLTIVTTRSRSGTGTMKQRKIYSLNTRKALNKKTRACERPPLEIAMKDGCTKLDLNTGTYELFRHAVVEYFKILKETQPSTISIEEVSDKLGAQTAVLIKAEGEHYPKVVIHLYHTTCSALVNGKGKDKFIEKQLPEIT